MNLLRLLFFVLVSIGGVAVAEPENPIAIVIHGGAGTILKERMTPAVETAYTEMLEQVVTAGYARLAAGGSAKDAVVTAITMMEDSELFNAGRGAVLNHEGTVELDASIMEGRNLNAGAVTGITQVRHPIELSARVMTESPHVMLMGAGAEAFAETEQLEFVPNTWFQTERRRRQLERVLGQAGEQTSLSEDDDLMKALESKTLGTVGAVALDLAGDIVAGTSTGGMTNKRFGRIGDSPIIGAGTYADNQWCGISATGHGEFFIRAAVAHDICARVAYKGVDLQTAADEVIQDRLRDMGADGGVIGLDPTGRIVVSFNSSGMYRAAVDAFGRTTVAIFK